MQMMIPIQLGWIMADPIGFDRELNMIRNTKHTQTIYDTHFSFDPIQIIFRSDQYDYKFGLSLNYLFFFQSD